MTTILALLLLWQFRLVVVYVLLSLALAAAARPLFKRPAGQPLVARLGLILLYLITLGGFLFLLAVSGGAAVRDIQELAQQVSVQDSWRQPVWLPGRSLQDLLDTRLPQPSQLLDALIGEQGESVLPAVLGFTQSVFSLLSGALVVLFMSIYWGMDQNHFERLWLSLLPPGQRSQVRDIWQTMEADLGIYIRRQAGQAFLAGLLLALGYWLLGSPYPALLALSGAVALLMPIVGPFLALVPPLLLGLLSGVELSLLTAVYTLIVITALKWLLESRLPLRAQVNPILTIVILLALADAYGLLGILFAPPLSAACHILWSRLVSFRAVSGATLQVSDLKERQAEVWRAIQVLDEAPSPLITSSMDKLAALIEKAEPVLNVES
ncbi:MAG: AI-2E family transporter [Chloroflexi bacterium]|nr:AI-2E family transporter [Chloroflexota bacterium]